MVQRYKFESKSQPEPLMPLQCSGCFQWFKGTNLKANHNVIAEIEYYSVLFPMVQRYKFESKSQLYWLSPPAHPGCFQWFKGTNLKANHNSEEATCLTIQLFPMVQRYKFESKSQPSSLNVVMRPSCFQWFKGTNLKANHNVMYINYLRGIVVSNGSKVQI